MVGGGMKGMKGGGLRYEKGWKGRARRIFE